MATLNLGAIRYNWKGAYDGSTAYVVNDVVSANGNSYICIQAGTGQAVGNATAYWNIMSSAGTNGTDGTDLTSTLTAQGDIVYRDGSGLAKLGAGTSGQALLTQGSGANPIWGSAGGIKQVITGESSTVFQVTSPDESSKYYPTSNKITATITPSSTSSKILVQAISTCRAEDTGSDVAVGIVIKESISGGSTTDIIGHSSSHYATGLYFSTYPSSNYRVRLVEFALSSPNTTSAITYEVGIVSYANSQYVELNENNSTGRIIVQEVTV